ncbi:MAG: prepilin-type N-terminal cleavage/methylation domain-containing protein [bacterium]|nr:prepilin-type N-terminal cleavage/methylation domain-containing protein [bacterium]
MEMAKDSRLRVGRAGMTVVELMVALVIFGVIIGVVFGFLTESRRSYSSTRQKAQYQQGLRAVMSLVTREIRSAGCDPTAVGFEAFPAADVNSFRCVMDLNGDTDTADTNPDEDVTYAFDAGTGDLTRTVGGANTVILRDLTNLQFNYYDADGNLLNALPLSATDRALIRSVDLVMVGAAREHEYTSYTTRIAMRNQ